MKVVIDLANIEKITKLNGYFPIGGVITNPSSIEKEPKPFLPLLKEIRDVIENEKKLFVQAIVENTEDIMKEAYYMNEP